LAHSSSSREKPREKGKEQGDDFPAGENPGKMGQETYFGEEGV
jgi:hypothetical protein